LAITAPIDWEISPREYQSSATSIRISRTNSSGDRRSAETAFSETSNVILAIIAAAATGYLRPVMNGNDWGLYTQTGRDAPREVLPIVSHLSADS
jgi:hypothetical protein